MTWRVQRQKPVDVSMSGSLLNIYTQHRVLFSYSSSSVRLMVLSMVLLPSHLRENRLTRADLPKLRVCLKEQGEEST